MQPDPEDNCSFPAYLYFTSRSILCRAEVSSEWGRKSEGQLAGVAGLGCELTRSGAAVTGLFWLRRKPRSRERKWLLCLCVFLYIGIHSTYCEPLQPGQAGVSWLYTGCRTEGGVTRGQITAEGTGRVKQHLVGTAFSIIG